MKTFKKSVLISLVFFIICGIIYPLCLTGIGQLFFPSQANGSMISENGEVVGSQLIGQLFTSDKYFHGRISAVNYNVYSEEDAKENNSLYSTVSSGSSNLAPSNPSLVERVKSDIDALIKKNPDIKSVKEVPTDLLTCSASGLDPDISAESAKIQVPRISLATGIDSQRLYQLIDETIQNRSLGIFGELRVNVLRLNIGINKLVGNS